MNSKERQALQSRLRAKRVYELRAMGLSVKETAEEAGCRRDQVRTLQLLGERLMQVTAQ